MENSQACRCRYDKLAILADLNAALCGVWLHVRRKGYLLRCSVAINYCWIRPASQDRCRRERIKHSSVAHGNWTR